MSGKGDKPRPVKKKVYDSNYEEIGWNNKEPNNDIRNYIVKKGKRIYKYP